MLPTITVIGNIKRIETKFTQSGKQLTKFQIECAEKNAKGEWTNLYLSGECWEKSAEFVNQYFNDGSPAIVTGKLYTNIYEKSDGSKVYENKLLFPSVSFAPKDKSDNENRGNGAYGGPAYKDDGSPNESYDPNPKQGSQQQQSYQAPQQSQYDNLNKQQQVPSSNQSAVIDIDIPF